MVKGFLFFLCYIQSSSFESRLKVRAMILILPDLVVDVPRELELAFVDYDQRHFSRSRDSLLQGLRLIMHLWQVGIDEVLRWTQLRPSHLDGFL